MINVTKAVLPDLTEYVSYLEQIWSSGHITNHGPLVCDLESQLRNTLGVKHLFFVTNGTIALQIAIKALELTGEIITTPFTYVATTSSIFWENCKPVFVDIDPETLCLDPNKIEDAITDKTSAILPVHVYGNPCEVDAIETIAQKHGLKVIYDAAHAFAVDFRGTSILNYGDISTLSFHATKLFHTVEGGAVATDNDLLAKKISYLRNFGHNGQEDFWGLGVNGKNSEIHAAMGLCLLPLVPKLIERRRELTEYYDQLFSGQSRIRRPRFCECASLNYSYYPVLFSSETELLGARDLLRGKEIFPRRYFYPCLNSLNYIEPNNVPIAEDIAKRVLCLPLYPQLSKSEVSLICKTVIEALSESPTLAEAQAL